MESGHDLIPNSESHTDLEFLESLEHEYRTLCNKEQQIVCLLERCTAEETKLQGAMKMAEDVPTASKLRSRKNQEREALKRLEVALMEESSGDDGDSFT